MITAREIKDAFLHTLFPDVCAGCGNDNPGHNAILCLRCSEAMPETNYEFHAGNPIEKKFWGRLQLSGATARYYFTRESLMQQLMHEFKYHQREYLRHVIGDWLAEVVNDGRLDPAQFDVIVPVPLHPAKQRQRGFNQAVLLARSLSARTGIRVNVALKRVQYTKTQTAFDRAERMENLRDAFRLRKKMDVRGLRVLLIDDVLTTGSTLSECARVLKRAGAISVHAATAARA